MRKLHVIKSEFGSPIDPSVIKEFEQEIGFHFPQRYINFMSKFDGKRLAEQCFKFKNFYNEDDVRDAYFHPFDKSHYERIYKMQISHYPDASPYFVQFATCANGDHICFDYRKDPTSSEPAVVVVFHDDVYIDENGEQKMVVNHIANSFGEFVDLLYEDRDPVFVIERIEIEV